MCFSSPRSIPGFTSLVAAMLLCVASHASFGAEPISLLAEGESGLGWTFENGQEFAGATGQLTEVDGQAAKEKTQLKLSGNFSGGGNYVQMLRNLSVGEVSKIVLKVRSENSAALVVRLIDETGQCHQRPIAFTPGDWQELEIVPTEFAGGEHWGGAEDGVWHGAPAKMAILILNKPEDPEPVVEFAEIRAEPAK